MLESNKYPFTKSEAIKEMISGNKITHSTFTDDEWITMENGKVKTEEGYKISPLDFWRYRTLPVFNSGYSIFKEN